MSCCFNSQLRNILSSTVPLTSFYEVIYFLITITFLSLLITITRINLFFYHFFILSLDLSWIEMWTAPIYKGGNYRCAHVFAVWSFRAWANISTAHIIIYYYYYIFCSLKLVTDNKLINNNNDKASLSPFHQPKMSRLLSLRVWIWINGVVLFDSYTFYYKIMPSYRRFMMRCNSNYLTNREI